MQSLMYLVVLTTHTQSIVLMIEQTYFHVQALAVPMVRRHARTGEDEHHYGPSVGVVSGNYVTGKRRGIVDGIDFGATGSGESLLLPATHP